MFSLLFSGTLLRWFCFHSLLRWCVYRVVNILDLGSGAFLVL